MLKITVCELKGVTYIYLNGFTVLSQIYDNFKPYSDWRYTYTDDDLYRGAL